MDGGISDTFGQRAAKIKPRWYESAYTAIASGPHTVHPPPMKLRPGHCDPARSSKRGKKKTKSTGPQAQGGRFAL